MHFDAIKAYIKASSRLKLQVTFGAIEKKHPLKFSSQLICRRSGSLPRKLISLIFLDKLLCNW